VHLAVAGEPHDVAGNLGHGRGDQRLLCRGEPQATRQLAGAATRKDDVGIGLDRDLRLVLTPLPTTHQRKAQLGAEVALEKVPGRIDLPLSSPIADRQGEQDRSTVLRRRVGILELKEVLHPEPGAAAVQLRGDRTGRHTEVFPERARVLSGDLVREQGLPLALGQARQRRRDGVPFLALQQVLVGRLRR
jgi:hypothetical protein